LGLGAAVGIHDLTITTGLNVRVVAGAGTTRFAWVTATRVPTADIGRKTTGALAAIVATLMVAAAHFTRTVRIQATGPVDNFIVTAGLGVGGIADPVAAVFSEIATRVPAAHLRGEAAILFATLSITALKVVATGVSLRTFRRAVDDTPGAGGVGHVARIAGDNARARRAGRLSIAWR
jgi:hypothetical protein